MAGHLPVMPEEVLEHLAPRAGGTYVDCTLGAGGHSGRIAVAIGTGRLFGFDKDPAALALATTTVAETAGASGVEFAAVQGDFADAPQELARRGIARVDGVLADLGLSSMQLGAADRGFSFAADGPLDMRMDPRQPLTAEQVVNHVDERELADLIFQFGEERRSRSIARAIVRSRPLHSTAQLAGLVAAVVRPVNRHRQDRIHPATRTFQALRIFVNSEMSSLNRLLDALPAWLTPGGRAVIISFHSLEDRPVKHLFRAGAQVGVYDLLTPRALLPGDDEAQRNPRARSAKLRAVRRTHQEAHHG